MLKKTLTCAVVIALAGCSQPAENTSQNEVKTAMKAVNSLDYPETKKGTVVDTYFGENVADPYRWLEDDMSDETAQWVKTQNNLTFSYLEQIPYRDTLKQRLEKLMNYEKISAPFTEGDYTYFYKNDGLQNQYVLYRSKDGGEAEIFLDPNTFSEDGTTSMSGLSFSEDGSLLAYQISEGGSDWRKIIVIDTETKEQVEQALVDVKFSGVSWLANDGFYYSSYDKPEGSELSAKTDQHKVYYHKLGQAQSEDTLVFGDTAEQKHRYVGAKATKDGRYLFISASVSTSGNKLFIKDLTKPDSEFVTVVGNTDSDTSVIDNEGSKLFLVTNLNAPNKKVVTVDASNPQPENWQDFIPETENVLNVTLGGNTFFANYMVDAISKVKQYNKQGELIRDISLPGVGTAGGFGGKKEQTTLYYSFTNYKTPGTTYSFDVQSGESKVYRKSGIDFNSDNYTSEQVFYTSK
ncbi:MAG: S9 family peptidase, partial [Pseudomonadota bacterium]